MDCGGDKAFNTLLPLVNNDTPRAIDLLYKNMKRTREQARQELLAAGLTAEQSDSVLQYTHCEPPEAYFIASEDMIGKGGVWGHFGSWNFKKADLWNQVRKMTKDEAVKYMTRYNYSSEKAEQVYAEIKAIRNDGEANTWIAGWPGYYSGLDGCSRDGSNLDCGGKVSVNLSSGEVLVGVQGGPRHPRTLAFINSKGEYETAGWDDGSDVGVILVPDKDGYRAAIMAPEQAISMFTRMFYFEGHGLKYFKPLAHQTGFTGNNIYVYKVNWDGGEPNVVQKFLPRESNESEQSTVNESTNQSTVNSSQSTANQSTSTSTNQTNLSTVNSSQSTVNQSTNQSTINSTQSTVNQSTSNANQSTNDSERLKEDIFDSI